MKCHPKLKLILLEQYNKDISVLGKELLFRDGSTNYYERLYSFTHHFVICYFEPDRDLLEFLVQLQELIDKIKFTKKRR